MKRYVVSSFPEEAQKETDYFPAADKELTGVLADMAPPSQVAALYVKASWAMALVLAGSLRAPRMQLAALFTYYSWRSKRSKELEKALARAKAFQ